jgi:hypothetical protein
LHESYQETLNIAGIRIARETLQFIGGKKLWI